MGRSWLTFYHDITGVWLGRKQNIKPQQNLLKYLITVRSASLATLSRTGTPKITDKFW